MALVDEIGAILSTQSVASSSGEGGWYLALGMMPDSTVVADKMVAVLPTAGYAPDAATEVDRPGIQILTRGASIMSESTAFQDTDSKATAVQAAIHALTPGTYSTRHYGGIWAEQAPYYLGLDEENRPVFTQNFWAIRSRT